MTNRLKFTRKTLAWKSQTPTKCQICRKKISALFVDGRINRPGFRTWATMCVTCHGSIGSGLGTGCGQMFGRDTDGTFRKIWG